MAGTSPPTLITLPEQLQAVAVGAGAAPRVALDTEGNGLHAYRSRLCLLQIAWPHDGELSIAIVDPLALDLSPLRHLLGPEGPIKVLHDLSFDAAMLATHGLPLARVRDTSVAARFLEEPATGLSSLLERHLDVRIGKGLQKHDWARRPLRPTELGYLAADVRHLLALDDQLARSSERLGIVEEIALECAYKLTTALAPPRDTRPAYTRVKGYAKLDGRSRTVLWQLTETREAIAERLDQPPFRIVSNEVLLELARRKPRSLTVLDKLGRKPQLRRFGGELLAAVERGMVAGKPPPPPTATPVSSSEAALHKRIDRALARWRGQETKARQVGPQVVLPGHCLSALSTLLTHDGGAEDRAIAAVPGLGTSRVTRYAARWRQLAEEARLKEPAASAPSQPPR